jgi:hypothetical protein
VRGQDAEMTHDQDSYEDEDAYDETDTTVEEFDAMWEVSEPVETVVPTARNYVVSLDGGLMMPHTAEPTLAAFAPWAHREPITEPVAREAVSASAPLQ